MQNGGTLTDGMKTILTCNPAQHKTKWDLWEFEILVPYGCCYTEPPEITTKFVKLLKIKIYFLNKQVIIILQIGGEPSKELEIESV